MQKKGRKSQRSDCGVIRDGLLVQNVGFFLIDQSQKE